jgi:hypothetical protein
MSECDHDWNITQRRGTGRVIKINWLCSVCHKYTQKRVSPDKDPIITNEEK